MNIEISNLPPMPFEADWEYHYGPVPGGWVDRENETSPKGYYFNIVKMQWERAILGSELNIYARPKPKPAPEPEPEPYIDMPIFWNMYPMAFTVGIDGIQYRHVADTGLLHWQNGREYRLSRFRHSDGALSRFSVCDNLGRAFKAPHARFYLVAK